MVLESSVEEIEILAGTQYLCLKKVKIKLVINYHNNIQTTIVIVLNTA